MSTSKFEHKFEYHTDDYTLDITATWTEMFDKDYGADADGNRGWPEYFIEDMEIVAELYGVDITDTLSNPVFREIERMAVAAARDGEGTNLTKENAEAWEEFWADERRERDVD